MAKFWELKEHDGLITLLSPEQAASAKQQLKEGAKFLFFPKRTVAVGAIKHIEETRQEIADFNLLTLPEGDVQAQIPVTKDSQGREVHYYRWGKRSIPRKLWDSYYAPQSSYHLLEANGAEVVMAFKIIVGKPLKEGVMVCTDMEEAALELKIKSR